MGINNPIQLPRRLHNVWSCYSTVVTLAWTQQDLLWTNFVIIIQLPDHITAMKTDTHFTPYHTIVI